jgi:hypothetical protein
VARTELQGGQIRDLSVGTADLANGAVTAAKLGVGAIIGTDIQPYAEALNGVKRITSKSATGSLATNECGLILASASTGQITLTLPAVAGAVGLTFVIQKTDTSANTVIVNRFVNRLPLGKYSTDMLLANEPSRIPSGYKIRVTFYNASTTTDLYASILLTMFRKNTV